MRLIETLECNDGSGNICNMIMLLSKINTILNVFSLNDEYIKVMYNLLPNSKARIDFIISQRNSAKFFQYYNTKQCRTNGSFPFEKVANSNKNRI